MTKSIERLEFSMFEVVFGKQKGYPPWPAVIVDLHSRGYRWAKLEFFGWQSQWAHISYNKMTKLEASESIIDKNKNNIRFMKAVNEMKIWLNHRKTATSQLKSECLQELRATAIEGEPLKENSLKFGIDSVDPLPKSGDLIKNESSSDCMVIVTTSGSREIEVSGTDDNPIFISSSKGHKAMDSDPIYSANCGNTSEVIKSSRGESCKLSKRLLEKRNKEKDQTISAKLQTQTSKFIKRNATECLNLTPAKITVDSNSKTIAKKIHGSESQAKIKNNMRLMNRARDSNIMCSTELLQVETTNIVQSNSSLEGDSNLSPRRNPKRKVKIDVKFTAKNDGGHILDEQLTKNGGSSSDIKPSKRRKMLVVNDSIDKELSIKRTTKKNINKIDSIESDGNLNIRRYPKRGATLNVRY